MCDDTSCGISLPYFFIQDVDLYFYAESRSSAEGTIASRSYCAIDERYPFIYGQADFSRTFYLDVSGALFTMRSFVYFFRDLYCFIVFQSCPYQRMTLSQVCGIYVEQAIMFVRKCYCIITVFLCDQGDASLVRTTFPYFTYYRAAIGECETKIDCYATT